MQYPTPTLHQLFDSFGVCTPAEIEQILQYFEYKNYAQGTIIVDIGQINDKMYFIEKGILREFSYQDQDQEQTITHWLMHENNFVYLAESFLEQQPSKVALEVIENTKLWAISKQNIDKLYLDFPQLNLISRLMIEQYLKKYEGFIRMLRLTPEKRVEWYYTYNSTLANRVPLKYVATYLQMTPSTLSRARKRMAIRKSV